MSVDEAKTIDTSGVRKLKKGEWVRWIEGAESLLYKHFGRMTDVLRTGVKYALPPVTAAQYTPTLAPGEPALPAAILNKMKENAYTERQSEEMRMKRKEPSMYAALWEIFDDDVKEAIGGHVDFHATKLDRDPNRLAIIAKEVIESGDQGGAQLRVQNRLILRKQFESFKQLPGVGVAAFKKDYSEKRTALTNLGVVAPAADEEALEFLGRLDPIRFSGMMTKLRNDALRGIAMPATLDNAYQIASN